MPRETWTARQGSSVTRDPAPGGVRSAQTCLFRKEGEYWTVGYLGKPVRLRDAKGLRYIAHLLRYPAAEFHVLDLAGGIASGRDEDETTRSMQDLPRTEEDLEKAGIHITSLGDAGEMLDEQAKAAYRRRLSELREELEEAKERADVERAEQAEEEIDALTRELSRAVGLGGRTRRAGAASERARQSIAKSIKSVLERIAQNDATLADVLSRCIKTGTFCSYQPDLVFPITWEFAATDADSTIEPTDHSAVSVVPAPARTDLPHTTPAALEFSPFSLAERTAFVGRESEGSAVRAVIDRARASHGSIIMLWDGPGVGKTRLSIEMAEYASSTGFRCRVGHCYERDEPFPYLPFAEIIESGLARAASLNDYRRQIDPYAAEMAEIAPSLRRVFPDLPKPLELPAAQQRGYLFHSFSEVLARAARSHPQLFVLEDLHWADESTLALLIYLALRVAQLPLVIIGTYRSGYSDDNPALVRTLEELIRLGVRPLKLGGLSKDAVAQMLDGLSQRRVPESLLSAIFEESQGYPFFVEEVYRHLIEEGRVFDATGEFRTEIEIGESDVPENVRLIISRRLDRLDENENRALAAAAVIGRSFSFQLLTAISQIDVDELFTVIEKAQQMGIVVPSSEGPDRPFTFRHELVRQTLLARISGPRRQQLHASVAHAIEQLYPGAVRERASEIANHLLKAGSFGDDRRLVRYLTMAGHCALDAAAFQEARRSFRSALSYQGAVELREKAELLASLAMAERGLNQWNEVVANLKEALELYVELEDPEAVVRTVNELTEALFWAGRLQEAAETAQRGLTYIHPEASAERARLFATIGQAYALATAYEPAQEALREALEIASRLANPKLEAKLLGVRSIINMQFLRLQETVENGILSEQLGGAELPPWQRSLQLLSLHLALLNLGRVKEALRIVDQLEPLARKIGDAYSVLVCGGTRAWLEFGKAPDLAALGVNLQRVLQTDQKERVAHSEALSEAELSQLNFLRGNWADALIHAQAGCRAGAAGSITGLAEGTLFRLMAYTGDREGALAILDEKRALLPDTGQPNALGSWLMLVLVIEGLVVLGERSQVAQLYSLACELIATGAVTLMGTARFTQTVAGAAAAAAGKFEAAEQHFQLALQHAEAFPHRVEQADIRRFQAMMLIDRSAPGDRETARALLNEALESYERIGMPRHVEMTQILLARCR